jgi:3-hydroxyisobutyrate dehydrogenase-like beta-hydroxyacid dehydrogenase
MGSRMVKRLLAAGHEVAGYNRTATKASWLVALGMKAVASPRDAAAAGDVVLSMVTDSEALLAVARGPDGIIASLKPGSVWVEMSTVSPAVTRELAQEVAARGATLLDGPVSGSTVTIEQGQLTILIGGPVEALERARPYLLAIGPTVTHVGNVGQAVTMKIALNLGIAVQLVAFSEAVLLAEKAGIARERAVDAVLKSVLASPMLKYRGPLVLSPPPEALFTVPMLQKDLQLALDLARSVGAALPSTALAQELFTAARGLGLESRDCVAVFDVLARLSGLHPTSSPPSPEHP